MMFEQSFKGIVSFFNLFFSELPNPLNLCSVKFICPFIAGSEVVINALLDCHVPMFFHVGNEFAFSVTFLVALH